MAGNGMCMRSVMASLCVLLKAMDPQKLAAYLKLSLRLLGENVGIFDCFF